MNEDALLLGVVSLEGLLVLCAGLGMFVHHPAVGGVASQVTPLVQSRATVGE